MTRRVLGRTLMVANHAIVHHMQRKEMKEKVEPPAGWVVWIGHYQQAATAWLTRPFAVFPDDVLARRRSNVAKANSNASTIVIQNLFIHVAYCRDRRLVTKWRFSANVEGGPLSGHLFRIWPPLGHSISWPGKSLTQQDTGVIADAILNGVMSAARRHGLVPATPPPMIRL